MMIKLSDGTVAHVRIAKRGAKLSDRDVRAIESVRDALFNHKRGTMMEEAHVENEILAKGLTAPRITPEHINSRIVGEDYHVFPGTMLTVCCLTLANGFTVTGESACASPANFNMELGRKIARTHAREKIWALEGYLLKQRLSETPAEVR